jgi:DNA polymerase-1
VLRNDAKARRNSPSPERKTARGSVRRNAPAPRRRPLLVIDGDSFAHRAYHALPKTILRRGGRPAGAILGFANFLVKFYRTEQPRAVLVGWDTVDAPTYRHEQFQRPRIRRRIARAT